MVVALVDILSGEFDLLAGKAVEDLENNHGGNADTEANGMYKLRFRLGLREIIPTGEVVGPIIVVGVAPHHLGVFLIKQGEGAPSTADVDRLPQPVEYQHMPVEQGFHSFGAGGTVDR